MEKSEQYRDTKMTRRFHPTCPVPPPGEVTLVWCPLCSEIQRFGDLAPLCLLAVVETGEVAASGGGSLLPGLAPSGQGHVHTHTPWAAWSVTAPTHPHGCGLSPHGRSPEHLRRWWRGRWLWLSCCCCSEPPSPADTPLPVLLPRQTPRSLCFFQAGEKHYHPLCALCVRCGRMFAEGEEMYLQGKKRSVPPGARGARQALGDRALSRGAGGSVSFPAVREPRLPVGPRVGAGGLSPQGPYSRAGPRTGGRVGPSSVWSVVASSPS